MKKAIALLLGLLMILSLAACGQKPVEGPATPSNPSGTTTPSNPTNASTPANPSTPDAPATPKRETLSCAVTYDYGTLDAVAMGPLAFYSMDAVMEPLWEVNMDGSITNVLAESYEWVEDDHLVVHIRKGVTFSNGNPLTADDVMFSIEWMKDSGTTWGQPRMQTTDFERTKVRDEYTLDWYLLEPTIIHMTVSQMVFIYDKESYDPEEQAEHPIGTGPYVVTDYVVNSHLVVERRDDYWGELPELKTITFRMLAEPAQRINSMETGAIDAGAVPLSDVDYVDTLPNVTVVPRPGGWVYLGFNISQDGKLGDPLAREAICHAIDREAISNIVYLGKARVMHNPFSPAMLDYDPRWDDLGVYKDGYNLDLAKKMADETGLTGKTLLLANDGVTENVQISEMVQSMLSKIGVTCEIISYDSASYSQIKNDTTKFDILISTGTSGNKVSGDMFVNAMTRNKIYQVEENWPYNHGGRYFEIIPQTLGNMNDEERADYCYECMQYYVECNPTFGLVEYDSYYAFPSDLDLNDYQLRLLDQPFVKSMHFN